MNSSKNHHQVCYAMQDIYTTRRLLCSIKLYSTSLKVSIYYKFATSIIKGMVSIFIWKVKHFELRTIFKFQNYASSLSDPFFFSFFLLLFPFCNVIHLGNLGFWRQNYFGITSPKMGSFWGDEKRKNITLAWRSPQPTPPSASRKNFKNIVLHTGTSSTVEHTALTLELEKQSS